MNHITHSTVVDIKEEIMPYIDTDEKFAAMNDNEKIDLLNEIFKHKYEEMFKHVTDCIS